MQKKLREKRVLHASLFDVEEQEIEIQSGVVRTYHVVKRHPTVSVFPLTEDFEIYLVSQFRFTLQEVTLEAMAGFVDEGEEPLQAAKRELQEETGLQASEWQPLPVVELSGSVIQAKVYGFIARTLKTGKQNLDESEKITVVKLPLEEAVKKVLSGEINHASSVIGILTLDRMRRDRKL
ncbi:MAG: NUDIX hydrolase [Candidatus Levybacteria bacterium]|nr:NUDIX hydrolase [Candidatus Levybacteria bacterium]